MMTAKTLGAVAIAVAGFATPAWAESVFTINVPVSIQSLRPEVQFIVVSCRLSATDPVTNKTGPFGPQLKYQNVKPDASGAYSGTVTLAWDRSEFNTVEQTKFSTVHNADCNFSLMVNNNEYSPNFPGAGVQVQAKQGTPFVSTVSTSF